MSIFCTVVVETQPQILAHRVSYQQETLTRSVKRAQKLKDISILHALPHSTRVRFGYSRNGFLMVLTDRIISFHQIQREFLFFQGD